MKCGAIFSGYDARDYRAVYAASGKEFPKEFELKTVRIKNQEMTGSCVAHALSSIIEYYNNKQNDDPTEMSIGYIYGNRTTSEYKGEGMIMRDALEAVRKFGDVPNIMFYAPIDLDNAEVPISIELFELSKDRLFEYGYPHRISQYCRVDSAPKLVFDDIVDSLAFRDIEIGNPITAHLIEVDSRERTSTLYPTINASLR